MRRWVIAAVAATIILSISLPTLAYLIFVEHWGDPNYNWGDKGKLTLTLTAERTTMNLNGTLNLTATVKNVGLTNVRLWLFDSLELNLKDSNGTEIIYRGPSPQIPEDASDRDLTDFKAGGTLTFRPIITKDIFSLKANETYTVYAHFCSGGRGMESHFMLPYWDGGLDSNTIVFKVI